MLVRRRHGKRRQQQENDEDVIDAQRLLDEVAGRPFKARLGPTDRVDADVEDDGEAYPNTAPGKRFSPCHLVCVLIKIPRSSASMPPTDTRKRTRGRRSENTKYSM